MAGGYETRQLPHITPDLIDFPILYLSKRLVKGPLKDNDTPDIMIKVRSNNKQPSNRKGFVFPALVVWTGINFVPLFVIPEVHAIASWYLRGSSLSMGHFHAAYLVALFVMAFCGAFMLLLSSIAKGLPRRCLFVVAPTVLAANALFVCFVTTSWVWFLKKGLYLSINDLSLLRYIPDLAPFHAYVSSGDIVLGAALAFCSVLSAIALWLSVPSRRWRSAARSSLQYSIIFALLAAGCLMGGRRISPSAGEEFRFFLSHLVTPYGTLANDLLLGPIRTYKTAEDLSLAPLEDMHSYMQRVASSGSKDSRPNVLVLVIEALRHDVVELKHSGIEIMPTVNRLAREGLMFRHAYANAPETGYSQSTLMTGLHPLKYPTRDFNSDLSYPFVNIFDFMHAAGYRTANLGLEWMVQRRITDNAKIELRSRDLLGIQSRDTLAQVSNAEHLESLVAIDRLQVEQLSKWVRNDADSRPFFAFVYFNSSHFPYEQDPEDQGPFFPSEVDLFKVAFYGYPENLVPIMRNRYWNTLNKIDEMVADLTKSLAEAKRLDDTLIIITGDHGEMFHEHGEVTHAGRLHEGAIRVPFVVSGARGRHSVADGTTPVSHIDVVPTILDAVGLPPFAGFQGRSVLDSQDARRDTSTTNRSVFVTAQTGVFEDAIISYPFKFIRGYRGEPSRLFRLDSDPDEMRNIVREEGDIAQKLGARLERFRDEQLSYYALPAAKRMKFFPPPIPVE